MRSRIAFIVKYWICWVLLFEAARVVFLLANFGQAKLMGGMNLLGTLGWGLRMDMSMAAYISLPVVLLVLLSVFIFSLQNATAYKIYTGIVLFIILLLIGIDINIFDAWGYRLDASPLNYLKNPREAWASMSHLPIGWILLAFVILFLVVARIFDKFIQRLVGRFTAPAKKLITVLAILIVTALFIIPLRGGLQLAPLNQSSVYFSDNNFANQSAINPVWNFMHAVTHKTDDKTNPFVYIDANEANAIRDSLFLPGNGNEKILQPANTNPNIIFIVWESFTEKATHLQRDGKEITPKFNELKKEGIYFSNIYATGDRTDKGIVGVLSGYPAQPVTSIVKTPVKANKLPMISRTLANNGYNTSFYYGGELEFANMKAYLLGGNFKKFTSKWEFKAEDQNSKWGAHDGVVMKKVLEGLNKEKTPFFCTWLTLSSHEPFEVPVPTLFEGKDEASLFLNSLHYTDAVVYDFIVQCKQQAWWQNTIVVIVADHGHRQPPTGKKMDDFKIPVLLLGGALSQKGVLKDRVGSQVDIAATILSQLQLPAADFKWSRNLLDSSSKQWAYFSFNNGYGFVQPNNYYIFDNVGKKSIEQAGQPSDNDIKRGKAIQQLSFQDYLDK